jgi:hypothetical protein
MPYVSVIRFTPYDYLRMVMSFDPSSSGIGPSPNPSRQFNEWNGEATSRPPINTKYYESLVSWAPRFAEAVQRAFDGDESLSEIDYGVPQLPNRPQ